MSHALQKSSNRPIVAVLFGERSVEHEISIITALELISAMDTTTYEVLPIYIDTQGRWWTGMALLSSDFYKNLPKSLESVDEITLLPKAQQGVMPVLRPARRKGWMQQSKKEYRADVFLVAMHGQYGEDGCLQGLLELAQVPYTCCGVTASALAMNKYFCKNVFAAANIPVLPAALVSHQQVLADAEKALDHILQTPGIGTFPFFVKPNHLGSSIGIGVAHDRAGLLAQMMLVFRYDAYALIEPYVHPITEINVAVRMGHPPVVTPVEVPFTKHDALTYEDKYLGGGKKKAGGMRQAGGMVHLSRKIDPDDLPRALKEEVQMHAQRAYALIDARGVMRFDFIYDPTAQKLYFNELNPMPGSFAYYLWVTRQPKQLYTELISQLISDANIRFAQRSSLERSIGFKALFQSGV